MSSRQTKGRAGGKARGREGGNGIKDRNEERKGSGKTGQRRFIVISLTLDFAVNESKSVLRQRDEGM